MHHDGKRPGKAGGHLMSTPKAQYPPRWFKKSCNYLYMAPNEDPGNHGSLDLGGLKHPPFFFPEYTEILRKLSIDLRNLGGSERPF